MASINTRVQKKQPLYSQYAMFWFAIMLIALLVAAIGSIGFGISTAESGDYVPSCNGKRMQMTDTCRIETTRNGAAVDSEDKTYSEMVSDHYSSKRTQHRVLTTMFKIAAPLVVLFAVLGAVAEARIRRPRTGDPRLDELAHARHWTIGPPPRSMDALSGVNGRAVRLITGEFDGQPFGIRVHQRGTQFVAPLPVRGLSLTMLRVTDGSLGAEGGGRGDTPLGRQLSAGAGLAEAARRLDDNALIVLNGDEITCNLTKRIPGDVIEAGLRDFAALVAALPIEVLRRYGQSPRTW